MINAILIDDEPRGLNTLRKLLQGCTQVNIIAECQDAFSAKEKIKSLTPQLLFVDISMPGKSGFDLLNELEDRSFEIIFTTAYNDYALQAFKYSAVDYIMKPIDEDLLIEAVDRATKRIVAAQGSRPVETFLHNLRQIQTPAEMKMCLPTLKGFQVINLGDVIYCEAESSYTNFHLRDNRHVMASKPIIEYELLLSDTTFCRIHKSYLVNLSHVKEYVRGEGGYVILTNDKSLEVSRRKKDGFINKMKELFRYA